MGRFIDLTGRQFGRLSVLRRAELFNGRKPIKPYWLVKCSCGTEKVVKGSDLSCEKILSCGCYRDELTSVRTKKYDDPQTITINMVIKQYRSRAKLRDLDFKLTFDECVSLFLKNCFYCGQVPARVTNFYSSEDKRSAFITEDNFHLHNFICNGIDRTNNDLGYLNNPGQCVSCCSFCNNSKLDLPFEEWKSQIIRWSQMRDHQNFQHRKTDLRALNTFQLDTFQEIVRSYKKRAKKQGLQVDLPEEMFHSLFQQPCYYCGTEPYNLSNKYLAKDGSIIENKGCPLKKTTVFDRTLGCYRYNGIDRKDNLIGYILSNCVPCCRICNHAKEDMLYEDFVKRIEQLVSYQRLSGTVVTF